FYLNNFYSSITKEITLALPPGRVLREPKTYINLGHVSCGLHDILWHGHTPGSAGSVVHPSGRQALGQIRNDGQLSINGRIDGEIDRQVNTSQRVVGKKLYDVNEANSVDRAAVAVSVDSANISG
ncbi:unnamed protein product, partial [Timema podura]|nr:unnamed protein product [Timema podura]